MRKADGEEAVERLKRRRDFILGGSALGGALLLSAQRGRAEPQEPQAAQAAQEAQEPQETQEPQESAMEYAPDEQKRNLSGFRSLDWRAHFETLENGAIICDIDSRALHFWSEDGKTYKLYPSSIPLTPELTRRGRTKVAKKKIGPSWRPTLSMKKANPDWPDFVPPGPNNPLGTHALYLSWQYYLIHGTHDVRKIGRPSSSGCIGLYNEHISELFDLVKKDTQVLIL